MSRYVAVGTVSDPLNPSPAQQNADEYFRQRAMSIAAGNIVLNFVILGALGYGVYRLVRGKKKS